MDAHKIPMSLDDITPQWISSAIGLTINEDSSFKLIPNIQDGSGFLSSMIRVQAETTINGSKKPINLIVKLLPMDKDKRGFVKSQGLDATENNFYAHIVTKITEIVPELEYYFCKCYYSAVDTEDKCAGSSVLILDDLQPKGYYAISFTENIPNDRLHDVIKFMAKFHFASRAIEIREGVPLSKMYNFLQGVSREKGVVDFMNVMVKSGFSKCFDELVSHGAQLYVCSAVKNCLKASDSIVDFVLNSGETHPCLIHGDLWSNNILFRDGISAEKNTIVIDWQLLAYKNPTFDLTVTMLSCLPQEQVCKSRVDELLKMYYALYVENCETNEIGKQHDLKSFTPFGNFMEFEKFFYTYGMSYALVWFAASVEAFDKDMPRFIRVMEFLVGELKMYDFLREQIA